MMHDSIRFVGVGGAFETKYGNSSMAVDQGDGSLLLIDCGGTVYSDLQRLGIVDRVKTVLITHTHDDVGSLGSLCFHKHFITGENLRLVVPPKLEKCLRALFALQMPDYGMEHYVQMQVPPDSENGTVQVGQWQLEWVDTCDKHQGGLQTYAYILRSEATTVAYSGDLGDSEFLFHSLRGENPETTWIFHDMCFWRLPNKAHAFYADLEKHLGKAHLFGYHNNPEKAPSDMKLPLVWNDLSFSEWVRSRPALSPPR